LEEGDPARVVLLDQRRLPDEEVELAASRPTAVNLFWALAA
jgi:methylthioribose-1-phosphate isomerase